VVEMGDRRNLSRTKYTQKYNKTLVVKNGKEVTIWEGVGVDEKIILKWKG